MVKNSNQTQQKAVKKSQDISSKSKIINDLMILGKNYEKINNCFYFFAFLI